VEAAEWELARLIRRPLDDLPADFKKAQAADVEETLRRDGSAGE
jgi:hypothetical protein